MKIKVKIFDFDLRNHLRSEDCPHLDSQRDLQPCDEVPRVNLRPLSGSIPRHTLDADGKPRFQPGHSPLPARGSQHDIEPPGQQFNPAPGEHTCPARADDGKHRVLRHRTDHSAVHNPPDNDPCLGGRILQQSPHLSD